MKYFKKILVLFALLLVGGCSISNSEYNTEMVSSINKNSRIITNVNEYSDDAIKANVLIYNNNYSSFLGIKYKEYNTYGSGFIFDTNNDSYYILTNNHVVSFDYSYNKNELLVEDYLGNKYDGEVVYKDASYDLAVIRVEKKVELKTLSISSDNVKVRESIKTMGNPSSARNVITTGMVNCYSKVNLNNTKSNIDFEVLVHSASIKSGSSGGALLNEDNEVVGVTFAGVFDSKGSFVTGYAIPVSKIKEFLNNYIY